MLGSNIPRIVDIMMPFHCGESSRLHVHFLNVLVKGHPMLEQCINCTSEWNQRELFEVACPGFLSNELQHSCVDNCCVAKMLLHSKDTQVRDKGIECQELTVQWL